MQGNKKFCTLKIQLNAIIMMDKMVLKLYLSFSCSLFTIWRNNICLCNYSNLLILWSIFQFFFHDFLVSEGIGDFIIVISF